MDRQRIFARLANMAKPACLVCPGVMVIADILTITLHQPAKFVDRSISIYAAGHYGWLEKSGTIMVGACFCLIAINLWRVSCARELRLFKWGGILFFIETIGFILMSLFNTNLVSNVFTFHGLVHQISLITISVVFYLFCMSAAWEMGKQPSFKLFGLVCLLPLVTGLLVCLWLGYSYHYYHENRYMGLSERLITAANLFWIILVGPQVVKLAEIR